jgi:hypothetical protein
VRSAVVRESEASGETVERPLIYGELQMRRKKLCALYNSPCLFIEDGILAAQRVRDSIVEIPGEMVRRGVHGSLEASFEWRTQRAPIVEVRKEDTDFCHINIGHEGTPVETQAGHISNVV